jgi:protein with PEP-CTERM/exosortase system signal
MNKIKYIAAVLIGIAGLGLQQAKADGCVGAGCLDWTSTLNQSNGQGTNTYGTVEVTLVGQTATITFTALNSFSFIDGSAAGVNVNSSSFTHSDPASELPLPGDFKDFSSGNVDGLGSFNLIVDNKNSSPNNTVTSISFTVTNNPILSGITWADASQVLITNSNGFDAEVHYFDPSANGGAGGTFFAGEAPGNFTIPDGGTTVMLLGIGLSVLGMARRFVRS